MVGEKVIKEKFRKTPAAYDEFCFSLGFRSGYEYAYQEMNKILDSQVSVDAVPIKGKIITGPKPK